MPSFARGSPSIDKRISKGLMADSAVKLPFPFYDFVGGSDRRHASDNNTSLFDFSRVEQYMVIPDRR